MPLTIREGGVVVSTMPIEYVIIAREVEVLSARRLVVGQPLVATVGLASDSTTVAETILTTTSAFSWCAQHNAWIGNNGSIRAVRETVKHPRGMLLDNTFTACMLASSPAKSMGIYVHLRVQHSAHKREHRTLTIGGTIESCAACTAPCTCA
jgi:hypothetical protein